MTLCATSRGKELRSCRKDWIWQLHTLTVTVAVTCVSSVIDESQNVKYDTIRKKSLTWTQKLSGGYPLADSHKIWIACCTSKHNQDVKFL